MTDPKNDFGSYTIQGSKNKSSGILKPQVEEKEGDPKSKSVHPDVRAQQKRDVALLIGAVRLLSLALTWTFFQPDEYYQSLEPAWQLAFGESSGAWITWEWDHQLRSSLHPILIAGPYYAALALNWILGPPLSLQSRIYIWAPRLFHTLNAGTLDYHTWELAEAIFGERSQESAAALAFCLLSPWQFFAGSRSFSNGLEASLTAEALLCWPWRWYGTTATAEQRKESGGRLSRSITLAAFAVVLRPTNGLIWLILTGSLLFSAAQEEMLYLMQQLSIWGTVVLAFNYGLDRLHYGVWTFPAARFLGFNVVEGLSEFYGRNRLDYYVTEGLPLLLMTAYPFALWGFYQARRGDEQPAAATSVKTTSEGQVQKPESWSNADALRALATTALVMVTALSSIAHKEVRFLYPLLPMFAILAARPICQIFAFTSFPRPASMPKLALGLVIVTINLLAAVYLCTTHQRGPLDVMHYLRDQFYAVNTDALVLGTRLAGPSSLFVATGNAVLWVFGDRTVRHPEELESISAAFLMPCHSTPWRSHLVHDEINAWALTCEPPIGLSGTEKKDYLDEADHFYKDPAAWLQNNMGPVPTRDTPWKDMGWDMRDAPVESSKAPTVNAFAGKERRPWPRYVAFFEQLEPVMQQVAGGQSSRYEECWRGFNSHWHDDWRRQGDIIVWCVDGSVDGTKLVREHDAAEAEMRSHEL